MDQQERDWRGVVILGSHRSGTSAVTGVIDALGLPVCRPDDRYELRQWNARGNYEARSISLFDEYLLNLLGGAWWAPPLPPGGWASRADVEGLRVRGAFLFAAAHPAGRWVWKDPRACVLMPFWDLIFDADMPRIVVLRHPLECAASLEKRSRIPQELALAMTERNLRIALRDSRGMPVWVTTYDELLANPAAWCERAAKFVSQSGQSLDDPLPVEKAMAFLDGSLRHHHEETGPDATGGVPEKLRPLWDWAMGRRGIHSALSVKKLPEESADTPAILESAFAEFVPLEDGRVPARAQSEGGADPAP